MDPRDRAAVRRMINLILVCHDDEHGHVTADQINAMTDGEARAMLGVMTGSITGLLRDMATEVGVDPEEYIRTLAGMFDGNHLHVVPDPVPCTTEEDLVDTLTRSIEQTRPPGGVA